MALVIRQEDYIEKKGVYALTLEAGAGISHRYLFYDEAPKNCRTRDFNE